MGNMEQFTTDRNNERTQSPADDEDEEDVDEEHEQIRLVHTPEPIFLMENHRSSQSVTDFYGDLSTDLKRSGKECTSIECQNEFYSNYLCTREPKESSKKDLCSKFLKTKCKNLSPIQCFVSLFPILSWLPNYDWKKDLTYDAFAGFTVAVLNIPQGLAYALLANVEPIVGLYMGFFPVIAYTIFGTSRHVSIGTFAVICLMSGKVSEEKAAYYAHKQNETMTGVAYSTLDVATSLSFSVGVWQLIMGVLQLGSLSALLSNELISGFTTGCAIHVLTSQIKNLVGIKGGDRRNGIFKIPLTYKDIALGIGKEGNLTAVILSVVTVSLLVLYNELLKEKMSKKVPFPIPVELIAIIIGTLVSRYWITPDTFGISIVSHIPTGLPNPSLPPMAIVPDILVDSLIIAVVAYAISISMVKIFAQKHKYEIRPNQELLANAVSNGFGSFFSCAPIAVSLSRSLIQDQIGGKTQLAGLFSCGIILFVLLWIAPFFETLPHCILSSLVVVALKGMFLQFGDLPKAWKESRMNAVIWLVAFLGTVFLDIEYGLVLGVIITVANLLWKSNQFTVTEMGQNPFTNLFVEKRSSGYDKLRVSDLPGIKIIKLTGNLNFVTVETFTTLVNHILSQNSTQTTRQEKSAATSSISDYSDFREFYRSRSASKVSISILIMDFSSVSSVDPCAVKCIRNLYDIQIKQSLQILFAACPPNVLQTMDHCKLFDHINVHHFYPSIEHAVQHSQSSKEDDTINDSSNQSNTVYIFK